MAKKIRQEKTDHAAPAATKQRGRPFKKGESGNPAGRPKGLRNKATRAAEILLDGEAESLTRKAVDLAKEGNPVALRLCLERILPPRKDRPVHFSLPEIRNSRDAAKAMASVTSAVARSELSPLEGRDVGAIIQIYLNALENMDLEARVAALEERK